MISIRAFRAGRVVGIRPGGGGVLPFMGYMGMCPCEGYGFQAVSGSRIEYHFSGN